MERKKISYISKSPAQTKKIGQVLAKTVLGQVADRAGALVLLLRGDLGAGKTQFAQGFAKGMGIRETVNSPTFAIIKKYCVPRGGGLKYFYHIDCYRLGSGRDLADLGIGAILADPAAIIAIEWPSIVDKDLSLENVLEISIEIAGAKNRQINFFFDDQK